MERSPVRVERRRQQTELQLGSLVNSQKFVAYEAQRRRSARRWTLFFCLTILALLITSGVIFALWLRQKRELDLLQSLVRSLNQHQDEMERRMQLLDSEKRVCQEHLEQETPNRTEFFGGIEISAIPATAVPVVEPHLEDNAAQEENPPPLSQSGWETEWLFRLRHRWTLDELYSWKMLLFVWPVLFCLFRYAVGVLP